MYLYFCSVVPVWYNGTYIKGELQLTNHNTIENSCSLLTLSPYICINVCVYLHTIILTKKCMCSLLNMANHDILVVNVHHQPSSCCILIAGFYSHTIQNILLVFVFPITFVYLYMFDLYLLAPTGALIVIVCYYWSGGNFFRF